jgi:hypothetical protein
MTLAPIRGAPPGASIPDFPVEEPPAKPKQPTPAPASGAQPRIFPMRQPQTPIEIGGSGITLTFRVIPELPPISRASTTVHVGADALGDRQESTALVGRLNASTRLDQTAEPDSVISLRVPRSSAPHTLGVLRMSAANARGFLTDLRNERSAVVATGDEHGTVQIEYEITEAGHVFLVRKPGQRHALHRCNIDRSFYLKTVANESLADLGA